MWWKGSAPVDVLTAESEVPTVRDNAPAPVNLGSQSTASAMDVSAMDAPRQDLAPRQPINLRFLFVVLAVGGSFVAGVHLLHGYQMGRISSVFLKNAREAVAAGDSQEALRYVRQYLHFHPDDLEARILLADQVHQVSKSPRELAQVMLLYEGILRLDPEQSRIRIKLVDLCRRLGRYRDATVHLSVLILERPDELDLLFQLSECREALGEFSQAAATYKQLITLAPQDARPYERLAYLLRDELDQPAEADELIQQLMQSNGQSAMAYGVRARYRHRFGELKFAARDARIAFQLAPNDPEILLLAARLLADQLHAGQEPDFSATQIRTRLEERLAEDPEDKFVVSALIELDLADGRAPRAEERLRDALQKNPHDVSSRFRLADLLLVDQRLPEAEKELAQIRARGVTWGAVDFLEARIRIVQRRWLDAIRILESTRIDSQEDPALSASVLRHLGQCYEQIGHHHRRLKAFREAVRVNPASVEARVGLASAFAQLGQIDEALSQYQTLQKGPAVSLAVAELQLRQQLMLPPPERNWKVLEQTIDDAARQSADPDQTLKLRVMLLVAQELQAQARQLLQREVLRRPDALPTWILLAQLDHWSGEAEAAKKTLAQAEERFGSPVELELARLRLESSRPESSSAEWVLAQSETWSDLPENLRVPVLGGLADNLDETSQKPKEALQLWLRAADLQPDQLTIWSRVLKLALRTEEDQQAQRAIQEIRRIEGDLGPYWRLGEADRCLMHARNDKEEFDLRAQTLLNKLRFELPADRGIPLRLAEIAERRGEANTAIEHYKTALDLGLEHPAIVQRLVQLLSAKQRYAEADSYLSTLQTARPRSFGGRYGRLAAEVALRSQHRARALELARAAVAADSKNFQDHLWLGRILFSLDVRKQAEESIRQSLLLAPEEPTPRLALVSLLSQTDRLPEAKAEIDRLRQAVPPAKAALPIAHCLELTGQSDAAFAAYEQAAKANAGNGYLRWVLADFCVRSRRFPQAETVLRELLDAKPALEETPLAAVRRSLAQVLAQKPFHAAGTEALALIEQNLKDQSRSIPDLRLKAYLLAAHPSRGQRLIAVAVFEQLEEVAPLSTTDLLQQIQLLLNLDRWPAAREGLLQLMAGENPDLNLVTLSVLQMLQHGEVNDVTRGWLARLVAQEPEAFRTVDLRARLLVAEGKIPQAVSTLTDWLKKEAPSSPKDEQRRERAVRTLMDLTDAQDQLGRAFAADALASATEDLLRELIRLKPERAAWMVRFFTQRWRLDEAWDASEQAWDAAPPEETAAALVGLLQKQHGDSSRFAKIRPRLEAALKQHPDSVSLLLSAATIAQLCEEYPAAVQWYRAALGKNPHSITAGNELALLLVLQGKPSEYGEALRMIDQAIEFAGPMHFLLDTKASILLALGRPWEATQALEQAIADTPTLAKHFHLAEAWMARNEPDEAARAYQKALALGLSESKIHPLERPALQKLLKTLKR